MHMLKWMCGHTRKDQVWNDDIRDRVGVAPIEEKLVQHRLRWFGHIQRRPLKAPMPSGRLKHAENVKRGWGRPNLQWEVSVKRDLKGWDITKELAMDKACYAISKVIRFDFRQKRTSASTGWSYKVVAPSAAKMPILAPASEEKAPEKVTGLRAGGMERFYRRGLDGGGERWGEVVANCLHSLLEIWTLEAANSEAAGREIETLYSKPVVFYLLNKIKEFSEWAQCHVLELASKFIPSDNNEIFDIMNLLEDRLQHANGAVVLATIKVFLHLTMSMTDVHQQVYERIKAPLLTLFSDPSYVKKLKLEMLTAIANESNTYEIVTELCEYAGNVDVPIARESIRAVGKIALQQYDVNAIVDRLLQFLEMDKDYVTAETLVLVKDLLRKYPQWSHDCIAVVGNISSQNIQEPKGKAALIWMLGEYSQDMHDAPYVLENLVDNWDEEQSPEVRLHLLTAVMKCFFKRPPETQKALGATLAAGLADTHQDVHDRALFYYRLLQYDPAVAERVVNPPKQAVSVFADTQSSEIKDRIFDEFNSLSVVYQKPSYMFTDKEHRGTFEYSEDLANLTVGAEAPETVISAQRYQESDNDLLLSTSDKEDSGIRSSNGSYTSTYNAPSDLLSSQTPAETALINPSSSTYSTQTNFSLDDLLGLGVPDAPAPPPPPALALNSKPVLDPATFQKKWGQLALSFSQECSLSPQGAASLMNPQSLIRHMQSNYIQCIASGGQPPNYKFYFYGQKAGAAAFYLVECIVNTASAKAQLKIKAEDGTTAEAFSTLFQSVLSQFGHS
uniref:AP-2 complex subunit beta n=1 Tax=Aegilops tauschii TaxID=37682 RepID=R7W430_AEGTA